MVFNYPPEYKGPRPIGEQIKAIAKIFGLDPTQALAFAENLPALPEGAEGWFAIPRWETIAASYGEALKKVLAMIASKRGFHNYSAGQLGAEYLKQHAKTVKMFKKLGGKQKGNDILIVAAQFGMRYAGLSVRGARRAFADNEFGLGAFAIGIMLLTHPEREVRWEQLHVNCAGDKYDDPHSLNRFSYAPIFRFYDSEVRFDACWFDRVVGEGSASAFLPPS